MAEQSSSETYPEPTPWWAGPVEKLATALLIIAGALPVVLVTENTILAAFVGVLVATVFNVAYWKARGYRLREVYDFV